MRSATLITKRCAIYTRKSTDHNLDLAFNSLDAQREACEAYIKSQAHEGWKLIARKYDDGAFSGASLDRPALQELIDDVRANRIDIIVVYKVDRLTRSLADFAKLVELFDAHNVSFVSITQSFNTTSSMGRLTLNVLLSFAQFEREVIGERVRDKIAASKRKGIWVGGPVPQGYKAVNKQVIVDEQEADFVRTIFKTYLELGSIAALATELNRKGFKPKGRLLSNGRIRKADCFRPSPLAYLLKNRFYIGEVVYRGETFPGSHQPILDKDLFEAVQKKLSEQRVNKAANRKSPLAPLMKLIFDDRGNLMAPTHTIKKGIRYRYYVSRALLEGRQSEVGSVGRVSAPDIEHLVVKALRTTIEANQDQLDKDMITQHVERVIIHSAEIELTIKEQSADDCSTSSMRIPFTPTAKLRKGIVHTPAQQALDPQKRDALIDAIARSRRWVQRLTTEPNLTTKALAKDEQLAERYLRLLLPLAFLSPRIVKAIIQGDVPAHLSVSSLTRSIPFRWADQETILSA
jgi:site-specific DNA recombinase